MCSERHKAHTGTFHRLGHTVRGGGQGPGCEASLSAQCGWRAGRRLGQPEVRLGQGLAAFRAEGLLVRAERASSSRALRRIPGGRGTGGSTPHNLCPPLHPQTPALGPAGASLL